MRTSHAFTGLIGIATVLLLAAAAGAECIVEALSVADGRIVGPVSIDNTNDHQIFVNVEAGHSYSVEALEVFPLGQGSVSSLSLSVNAGVCPANDIAGTRDVTALSPGVTFSGVRKTFTAEASSTNFGARVSTSNASGVQYSFTWSDTTMYSPAWSTNGTFDTFYSFQNTTNGTCGVGLTLFNTSGTSVKTTSASIASGATFSTNTSALVVPRDLVGTARLTHDCPPGAILAEAAIANFTLSPTPYIQNVKFQQVRQLGH